MKTKVVSVSNIHTKEEEVKRLLSKKTQITSKTATIVGNTSAVDVVFVIDTTGSMDNKINGLLKTCGHLVDETVKLKLDTHFALVSFGDISVKGGGDSIDLVVPLTGKIESIKKGLANIPRNSGFSNIGETPFEAIQFALKIKHRPKATKVLVLITDEPAIQTEVPATYITRRLRSLEYLVFVIATEHKYYKDMADQNGGIWKLIGPNTNLSEMLNIFREMAVTLSRIAKDVHLIGGGSVKDYLKLKPPS